jgi:hypothetical protein
MHGLALCLYVRELHGFFHELVVKHYGCSHPYTCRRESLDCNQRNQRVSNSICTAAA